jgi:hypothetical protein
VFRRGERCLGRAVFAAKCSIIVRYPTDDNLYGPAVLWTLFGDPALRIRHRILTGVEDQSPKSEGRMTEFGFSISPNPCRAGATVRFSSSPLIPHTSPLSVYNAAGCLVYSQPVRTSSFVISTSSFAPGVYIVELSSPPEAPLRKKLVVR